jgi:hypothetical protein
VVELTDEIRRAVAAEQCATLGHDLDPVLVMMSAEPVRLLCSRCGRGWPVGPAQNPAPELFRAGGVVENAGGGLVIVALDYNVVGHPQLDSRVELIGRADPDADPERPAGDGPLDR